VQNNKKDKSDDLTRDKVAVVQGPNNITMIIENDYSIVSLTTVK